MTNEFYTKALQKNFTSSGSEWLESWPWQVCCCAIAHSSRVILFRLKHSETLEDDFVDHKKDGHGKTFRLSVSSSVGNYRYDDAESRNHFTITVLLWSAKSSSSVSLCFNDIITMRVLSKRSFESLFRLFIYMYRGRGNKYY